MNGEGVRHLLFTETRRVGQKAWADSHKISTAYVNDVLTGRRDAGAKILKALGLKKVVSYEKAKS